MLCERTLADFEAEECILECVCVPPPFLCNAVCEAAWGAQLQTLVPLLIFSWLCFTSVISQDPSTLYIRLSDITGSSCKLSPSCHRASVTVTVCFSIPLCKHAEKNGYCFEAVILWWKISEQWLGHLIVTPACCDSSLLPWLIPSLAEVLHTLMLTYIL